jgi:Tfp pilus assembly protein PilF
MDTLNLFEQLLARGRRMQELGQPRAAAGVYSRLTAFRTLPPAVAEQTRVALGVLCLKRRRYRRARRHFAVALSHRPDSARYHFLLATAFAADKQGDLAQAEAYYRRALELDPGHVRCRSDAGLLLLRLGRTDEGLALLREAVERAPGNAEALAKLARGLVQAGRADEAHAALRVGVFRNGRDGRFRKLWDDFRFHRLRGRQEAERPDANDEEPVLLPFVRVERGATAAPAAPTILRRDDATPLPPTRRLGRPEQWQIR